MLRVYNCIATQHDLRLVAAGGFCLRPGFVCRRQSSPSCRTQRARDAPQLACRCCGRHRFRHLGDALHRHAGLPAGNAQRLQHRLDVHLAGRGDRADRRRPGGRRVAERSVRALDRRRHRRRRHCRHALYRHGSLRDRRPHRLGRPAGRCIDRARRPVRRGRPAGCIACQHDDLESAGRSCADACHLQPPFHRHGRCRDHPRSAHHRFGNGAARRLAGDRRRAGFDRHRRSGACRPVARSARPPHCARERTDARPCQRGCRRADRVRCERDRRGQ